MKRAADRDPDHHMGRLRGHYSPSNKAVERYRSANDGMMITMFFPAISGRAANLQCRRDRRAGGDADRDAFEPRSMARHSRGRVWLSTVTISSIDRRVEHRRHEARADPLDFVRSWLAARKHRRFRRLDGDDLQCWAARLQHLADAGDRAAGADAGRRRCRPRRRCRSRFPRPWCGDGFPDWRDFRIAAASPRPGVDRCISSALAIAPFMPFGPAVSTSSRAEQRQHLAALDRHRLRHDQDQLVAARRGDERERDACIAGGRLDQRRFAGRILPALPSHRSSTTPMRSLTLAIGLKNSSFARRLARYCAPWRYGRAARSAYRRSSR